MLSQLNDNEIIILSSYTYKNRINNEFRSKYENILNVPLAYIGADKDSLAKIRFVLYIGKGCLI